MKYLKRVSQPFSRFCLALGIFTTLGLTGCAVTPLVTDQYKLTGHSEKRLNCAGKMGSVFVNMPEAVVGYQTDSMLYMQKPYKLMPFVHHAWISPPAGMLLPLIVQSLSRTGCFTAVNSSPSAATADYMIETQLLELHQNFLVKPSEIAFVAKVSLIRSSTNQVVSSRIMKYYVKCRMDTPYGGVIAANHAAKLFTEALTHFIVAQIRNIGSDHRRGHAHYK